MLCNELENDFYCKPVEMDKLFKRTPCHDLSNVLKKLLRDLPQPLLTVELIDAFYQSHGTFRLILTKENLFKERVHSRCKKSKRTRAFAEFVGAVVACGASLHAEGSSGVHETGR